MRTSLLPLGLVIAVPGAIASACPFCGSSTGEQVRAGIFNQEFLYNIAAVALPFPLLLLVVLWVLYGGATARETKEE